MHYYVHYWLLAFWLLPAIWDRILSLDLIDFTARNQRIWDFSLFNAWIECLGLNKHSFKQNPFHIWVRIGTQITDLIWFGVDKICLHNESFLNKHNLFLKNSFAEMLIWWAKFFIQCSLKISLQNPLRSNFY